MTARLRAAMFGAACVVSAAACHRGATPSGVAGARAARPELLVSTEWLARHAGDRDLVILQVVASRAQYDSGHVPGARPVLLADVSTPNAPGQLTLQLPPVEQLATWARANGIGDRSRVVVVSHGEALQSATRVVFTLAYLGLLDRTSLLDGPMALWRREGRPVSTEPPPVAAGVTFTPRPRPELVATLDEVERITSSKSSVLIDARLPRFYEGDGGGYPRPGHIPSAVNVPLTTVADSGRIKPAGELTRIFADAGVANGQPLVTYCHIGQQATLLWFVATLVGRDVRLFDGSFQEWSGTARLPVVLTEK